MNIALFISFTRERKMLTDLLYLTGDFVLEQINLSVAKTFPIRLKPILRSLCAVLKPVIVSNTYCLRYWINTNMSGWIFMSGNDLKSFQENYEEIFDYSDAMWSYLNKYYFPVHFHRAYKYWIMLSSVS